MNSSSSLRTGLQGLLLIAIAALVGCGSQSTSQQVVFTLEVSIGRKPAESVRVALVPKDESPTSFVLEGITDHSGKAGMMQVPGVQLNSTPTEYTVVCESLGDWQIISPWSDAEKTPLNVTWPDGDNYKIDLPITAVRSL